MGRTWSPGERPHACAEVRRRVLQDPCFVHDETRVFQVERVADLADQGHGVVLERKGVSAGAHDQRFRYEMRIHNPALSAPILVAGVRVILRQPPGAYTIVETPPVDFLPGPQEAWIRRLV